MEGSATLVITWLRCSHTFPDNQYPNLYSQVSYPDFLDIGLIGLNITYDFLQESSETWFLFLIKFSLVCWWSAASLEWLRTEAAALKFNTRCADLYLLQSAHCKPLSVCRKSNKIHVQNKSSLKRIHTKYDKDRIIFKSFSSSCYLCILWSEDSPVWWQLRINNGGCTGAGLAILQPRVGGCDWMRDQHQATPPWHLLS